MIDKATLFEAGFVVRTPGALLALIEAHVSETSLIERHQGGDYGELCDEDREANERAVAEGGRVFSSYALSPCGSKVWVITEADRSVTTLLLPSEY
ncbi:hypothetical protein [Methylibium rhizosphaerae]|uniref:hypothetical protein n=1 Tax=Methylibium rhizosphaerae TaxID=2570323 RepID=UPI00112E418A|nr:hypothetical protein [Methylibium rhizosphaerae]